MGVRCLRPCNVGTYGLMSEVSRQRPFLVLPLMFEVQTYKGISKGWIPVVRRSSAADAERFQRLLSRVRPGYSHRVRRVAPATPARPLWGLTRQDWADIGHSMAVLGAVYGVVCTASLAVHIIVPVPDTAQHVLIVED